MPAPGGLASCGLGGGRARWPKAWLPSLSCSAAGVPLGFGVPSAPARDDPLLPAPSADVGASGTAPTSVWVHWARSRQWHGSVGTQEVATTDRDDLRFLEKVEVAGGQASQWI